MRFILFPILMLLISPVSFADVTRAHKSYLLGFIKDLEVSDGHQHSGYGWGAFLGNREVTDEADEELTDELINCRYKDSLLDKWLPEYSDRRKCSAVIVGLLLNNQASYMQIKQAASDLRVFSPEQEERIEVPVVL